MTGEDTSCFDRLSARGISTKRLHGGGNLQTQPGLSLKPHGCCDSSGSISHRVRRMGMAYLNSDCPIVPLQQANGSPACAHLALKPQEDFLGYFTGAYRCTKCRTLVTLPDKSPVDQPTEDSTIPADRRDDSVQCGTSLP